MGKGKDKFEIRVKGERKEDFEENKQKKERKEGFWQKEVEGGEDRKYRKE